MFHRHNVDNNHHCDGSLFFKDPIWFGASNAHHSMVGESFYKALNLQCRASRGFFVYT